MPDLIGEFGILVGQAASEGEITKPKNGLVKTVDEPPRGLG